MSHPEIDFLSDENPDEVTEQTADTPPVAETVATPEPPAPVVPTTPEPKEEHVPLAALRAERAKRQEYEARLRQYEQQQVQQQPQPNFYEAPEQYLQTVLQSQHQQMTQMMLGALEAQAREVYPDYDEVFEIVQEQAAQNPVIAQQVLQAQNPAMAAYKLGKQLREMQAMRDPDAYRKQIESEVRAKVEAEFAAKDAARLKAASAIPPDLTAVRASKDEDVLPDDSLEAILNSRNKR